MDNIEYVEVIGPGGAISRHHRIDALELIKTGLYKRYEPPVDLGNEKPDVSVKSITVKELRSQAATAKIPGYQSMKKAELIAALS